MNLEDKVNSDFVKELETATKAVRVGGKIIRDNYLKSFRVVRKNIHELVTEVDMFSQQKILDILVKDFPDYGIISEELNISSTNKKMTWFVDPLDGTHNYIAGLPFSSVSVGLGDENEDFYLGVIYFPLEDKLFHAVRSKGAFCNGEPIHVSKNDRLDKSVVNYDNQFHLNNQSFVNLERIAKAAFTIRILGTATVDLCFISNGMVGTHMECNKNYRYCRRWCYFDRGRGKITTFQENEITFNSSRVVASNSYVHEQVLNILDENLINTQ